MFSLVVTTRKLSMESAMLIIMPIRVNMKAIKRITYERRTNQEAAVNIYNLLLVMKAVWITKMN
jgi:hypothetical protein